MLRPQVNVVCNEVMNLQLIDKPEGITTHQSEPNDWGIVEFIAQQSGQTLYVTHRLDKETSGALLVAKDRDTAKNLTQLFEQKVVSKRYFFLTDRQIKQQVKLDHISHHSYIERDKQTYTSSNQKESNAFTDFSLLWNQGGISLWEARPITGKSHQIRLHAQDLGIPVLGDKEHGGTNWSRMCLHAQEINFVHEGTTQDFKSITPWWSEQKHAELIANSLPLQTNALIHLMNAYEKRQRLKIHNLPSFRFSHAETDEFSIDIYNTVAWINWYKEENPTDQILTTFESYFHTLNKSVFVRKINNRGQDPNTNQFWSLGKIPDQWTTAENGLHYELRTNQGLSAGLFLDQRANRAWVKENGADLRVLNLYSYTCGFSVAATAGGAKEVCSVDTSAKFLDWGKRNFEINNLDVKKFEFWAQDCLLFLKGTAKRKRQFDLIIVDPPSFGRSKDQVFKIEKDWTQLLDLCNEVLALQGKILFSTNYEKWEYKDFQELMQSWAMKNKLSLQPNPIPGLDYELSSIHRLLKCVVLIKTGKHN